MGEKLQKSSHIKITNEDDADTLFNIKGTVQFEFISQGQTVNQTYYWSGYGKLYMERGLNFSPVIGFSTMTMLQLTQCCQAVLAQKSITEMEHLPVPLLGSK